MRPPLNISPRLHVRHTLLLAAKWKADLCKQTANKPRGEDVVGGANLTGLCCLSWGNTVNADWSYLNVFLLFLDIIIHSSIGKDTEEGPLWWRGGASDRRAELELPLVAKEERRSEKPVRGGVKPPPGHKPDGDGYCTRRQ